MINWNKYDFTKEEFIKTWYDSRSKADCFKKLKFRSDSQGYRFINDAIKELNLSSDHIKGQGWNKGLKFPDKKTDLELFLANKNTISSYNLKNRLLEEDIFDHKCYKCNRDVWMGKPIPLHLEHIDGNHLNNNLDNLTLLCPNCHSQTITFRRKKGSKNE